VRVQKLSYTMFNNGLFSVAQDFKGEPLMSAESVSIPADIVPRYVVDAALAELALTTIHHVYGAVAFATVWRFEVVAYSAGVAVLILALSFIADRHRRALAGQVAFWLNALVITVFPVLGIGMAEGGYNHIVKNIVYFGGEGALYRQMFPAPTYEIPSDWFFEISGILQFPLALVIAWLMLSAWRHRH
ncbi:MAG TPA: hypothetical protein VL147_16050, partial [Devosia sp.]|nr:hypothetical protein [Devosia sp.]